jgi:prophage regulatory protein
MSIENATNAITNLNHPQLLRLRQLKVRMGLSRSTIYRLISEKNFPKPIQLGAASVAWIADEIDAWIQDQIKLRNNKATT